MIAAHHSQVLLHSLCFHPISIRLSNSPPPFPAASIFSSISLIAFARFNQFPAPHSPPLICLRSLSPLYNAVSILQGEPLLVLVLVVDCLHKVFICI